MSVVHAQDLDGDRLAGRDDLRRVRHARPPHLGDVEQALHAAPEVDEGAELAHGGDATGQHRAGDDRLPDFGGLRALLLLEQRTPRDDEVPAALPVLDDPERVDVSFVLRRVRGPEDVDLRHRAEGALAGDAHFVPALHDALDLAFHREAGAERVLELPVGRGPPRQLPGERQSPRGRHDHRLDAVADRDLESAVVVLQLGDVDCGLALAADVDERDLRADRDDRALDGLPLLEAPRLARRLEHRGEIFFAGSLTARSCGGDVVFGCSQARRSSR